MLIYSNKRWKVETRDGFRRNFLSLSFLNNLIIIILCCSERIAGADQDVVARVRRLI